jgi:hypothetical protein
MKIKVNIDSIGKRVDEYIEEKISTSGFPSCLGSMVPPIISKQVFFDEALILTEKEAVSEKEILYSDISKIVDVESTYSQNKVITKNKAKTIENYKEERANKYAEQVLGCCNCTFVEVCNKLTNNYLKVISIQESIKLQEVLKTKSKI